MYIFVHQDQGVQKGGTMFINEHYPLSACCSLVFVTRFILLYSCYYYQYLLAIYQSTSQWTWPHFSTFWDSSASSGIVGLRGP